MILDVIKDIGMVVVYWVFGNVVCCGDNMKIVGIVIYLCNLSM